MSLRVPTSTTYSRLERGLAVSLSRVQTLQAQLGSQSRIAKYSDDPVGAASGLRLQAQERDWDAYQRTGDDASAALGVTDGALQTSSTLLRQVSDLAIGAVNGALDPGSRSAIAQQIANLRDQLSEVANTEYLGRAVFGGHSGTAVSVDRTTSPPTYAYGGDDGAVDRQVTPSVSVRINLDGRTVFGFDQGAGKDVFSALSRLEASVRANDQAGMAAAQDLLKGRTSSVAVALGEVGALSNRVESAQQLGGTVVDRLTSQRSQIEDVDIASTVLHLQAATNAYQAALGAVARADLPSLANFLH